MSPARHRGIMEGKFIDASLGVLPLASRWNGNRSSQKKPATDAAGLSGKSGGAVAAHLPD
jgi:hypothetical protein